jgi:hypothetical protein
LNQGGKKMEEILFGALGGIVIVAVATKSKMLRGAAKKVIKTGYCVTAAATAGSAGAIESVKALMAEGKAEFEASRTPKAVAAK